MSGAIQTITGTGPAPVTMSSREIADLTGKDLSNIHRDIRGMLIGLHGDDFVQRTVPEQYRNRHSEFIRENATAILDAIAGNDSKRNHRDLRGFSWERDSRGYITVFHLDYNHTMTLVAGYNVKLRKAIIDKWQELEAQVAAPPALTPAEMFLQNAQAMVAVERRQLAQAQELARISESVDTLMTGSMTLTERPANSEAITHIRPRMLKKYQLPARIVDLVMRQMPYSPRPAGMVRNHREEALGASYAVYWVKDVNTTFSRFVRDCKRVTATKVTHPDIDERFTLAPGAED